MLFSQPFLNKIALFLCSYESWESENFKSILTLTNRSFQTKVISLSILIWVFLDTLFNNESFWDILQSKLLSYFPAYLRQFKSKSHIQGHPQKVENQSFHMTPSLMGFQALLLEILALNKGTNLFNRACMSRKKVVLTQMNLSRS